MRIVAFSDTHQNTALFAQSVHQAIRDGKIDVFIHCGDGVRDLEAVEETLIQSNPHIRIYAVRGNCDLGAPHYAATETADLNGMQTLITHGNQYRVKHGLGLLSQAARSIQAQLVFFGHTHQALIKEKHGVTFINPGSLYSWTLSGTAYLEVLIDRAQIIDVNFIKLSPEND